MRMMLLSLALVAACSGDAPSGRSCDGTLYDKCADEHECMSANCHNFMDKQFQVCSISCTVGDDSPCMFTAEGGKATCVAGICTPPSANVCER